MPILEGEELATIKNLLDGAVDDLLELPVAWVRTHRDLLWNSLLAPFHIDRALRRPGSGYLRVSTVAVADLILMAAIGVLYNGRSETDGILSKIFSWQTSLLQADEFLGIASTLLLTYYLHYAFIASFGLGRRATQLVQGTAFFFTVLTASTLVLLYLLKEAVPLPSAVERTVMVVAGYGVAAWYFPKVGTLLLRLRNGRTNTSMSWLLGTVVGAGLFTIYLVVVYLQFGWSSVWPD